jgi:hypothetical protein
MAPYGAVEAVYQRAAQSLAGILTFVGFQYYNGAKVPTPQYVESVMLRWLRATDLNPDQWVPPQHRSPGSFCRASTSAHQVWGTSLRIADMRSRPANISLAVRRSTPSSRARSTSPHAHSPPDGRILFSPRRIHAGTPASRSYVLAALRALHLDPGIPASTTQQQREDARQERRPSAHPRLDRAVPHQQTKRVGCGFRNMDNHQRRIMSHIALTRVRPEAAA